MPRFGTLYVVLFLVALAAQAGAQESPKPTPREAKAAPTPRARAARDEADPLAAQRRTQAVSLLTSLADEARGFRDEVVRARAQARAADALWETDGELSRALFRRAWEAADAADREFTRKLEEERRAQLARHGSAVTSSPPELRAEVLRLAARRDRALGEEFLALLSKAAEREAEEAAAKTKAATSASGAPPDAGQRLALARELLEEGDTERALQFAEPALGRVNMQTLAFLSALRLKDAGAADRHFASLLSRASADPSSDANTASLLASYAFTPFMFFTAFRGGGTGISLMRSGVPAPDLAPDLRASLLRTASRLLLRPATLEDYDRTPAGRSGTYLIIRRLLPLFERHAPDLAPALNARVSALLPDVPGQLRTGDMDRTLAKGIVPEDPSAGRDEVKDALERAERTSGTAERDQIYAAAAANAAWRGDPRAQELTDKIKDLDLLRRVRAFGDFAFVRTALEKKDAEGAIARARKGDLSRIQRVWAFERAAGLVAKAERERAVSLLEEAAAEARRIGDDDPDRARALVAVATRYEQIDRARSWELMTEASKAANTAPGFSGEDGKLTVELRLENGAFMTDFNVQEFDLPDILGALAGEDWNRTIQLAEGFDGEAARVAAVVALARTALVKKR